MSTDRSVRELLKAVARLLSTILCPVMLIFGLIHFNRNDIPRATFDIALATFAAVISGKD